MTEPVEPSPIADALFDIDVHGTSAWVIISRDQPLAVMTMSYARANRLQADLRKLLISHDITPEEP